MNEKQTHFLNARINVSRIARSCSVRKVPLVGYTRYPDPIPNSIAFTLLFYKNDSVTIKANVNFQLFLQANSFCTLLRLTKNAIIALSRGNCRMELQRSLKTVEIITHNTKVSRAIKDGRYKEIDRRRSQDVFECWKAMHRSLCDTKIATPQFL